MFFHLHVSYVLDFMLVVFKAQTCVCVCVCVSDLEVYVLNTEMELKDLSFPNSYDSDSTPSRVSIHHQTVQPQRSVSLSVCLSQTLTLSRGTSTQHASRPVLSLLSWQQSPWSLAPVAVAVVTRVCVMQVISRAVWDRSQPSASCRSDTCVCVSIRSGEVVFTLYKNLGSFLSTQNGHV